MVLVGNIQIFMSFVRAIRELTVSVCFIHMQRVHHLTHMLCTPMLVFVRFRGALICYSERAQRFRFFVCVCFVLISKFAMKLYDLQRYTYCYHSIWLGIALSDKYLYTLFRWFFFSLAFLSNYHLDAWKVPFFFCRFVFSSSDW